jgi:ABC-type multidrug transport system ATPase subunit
MSVINAKDLTKTYDKGSILALDKVSFEVNEGELFGIIGPDGAGKTSLFRLLATLLLPDSGEASIEGLNIYKDQSQIRSRVGYMPGRFSLYQDLTVEENLEFFATLFGTTIEENYALIRDIYDQIKPFGKRRAGKLSGGMKQKLALCCALIHNPQLLFLDEPTTGVDVVSRREFWEMLHQLKTKGITILVSTPYMDEAMRCERIALMQTGKIMTIDTPRNIISAFPDQLYAIATNANGYRILQDTRTSGLVSSAYAFGESIHITLNANSLASLPRLREHLATCGHPNAEIREIHPSIEDSFMRLMTEADKVSATHNQLQ